MDTSILTTLHTIAPDLMQEIELRTLVLERVAALEPIGRRALAQRLHLPEREVRSAADALRASGMLTQSAAGMELTQAGREMIDAARTVSRARRSLSAVELALSRKLRVQRVVVVHGDADIDGRVRLEAAQAAARQVRFFLQDAHVLAVSGGALMAQVARETQLAAAMDVTVVPAQGGSAGPVAEQPNAVAERFGVQLGGQHRLLHLPEGISQQAADELARLGQVREALELLRHADALFYEIGRADRQAVRRGQNAAEREALARAGAAGEMLGLYISESGAVVGGRLAPVLRAQDMGVRMQTAAIAVGSACAQAVIGACMHHAHKLLVVDEGAAMAMLSLLKV